VSGDFALPVAALAATTLLAGAGAVHTARTSSLRDALTVQHLLPAPARRLVGATLGPLELVLAGAGLLSVVAKGPATIGVAIAALGAGFFGFVALLLRRRPGTPCGCAGGADPTAPLDLGRALVVLAGGLAIVTGAGDRFASLAGPDRATALLAGVGLAMVVDLAARANRPATTTITVLGREP